MVDILLPIFLIVLGMVLLFIEAVMPSFGIIGVAGIGLVAWGVLDIWSTAGMMWGIVSIAVATPVFVVAMVLFFRSRASRVFVQQGRITGDSSDTPLRTDLIGRQGVAATPLRPSGIAQLGGERLAVVADGEFIEKGAAVTVVAITTNSIVVQRTISREA